MALLHPGDAFPALTIEPVDGEPLNLPDAAAGRFAVILFYRGAWCPYCNAQLRAFQRAHDRLAALDADVFALSVDDAATTRELVAKHGLTFSVGHGADAQAVAAATGAFVNHDPEYLQSTGFVLGPDGRVIVSVYSSGDRAARARGRRGHDRVRAPAPGAMNQVLTPRRHWLPLFRAVRASAREACSTTPYSHRSDSRCP